MQLLLAAMFQTSIATGFLLLAIWALSKLGRLASQLLVILLGLLVLIVLVTPSRPLMDILQADPISPMLILPVILLFSALLFLTALRPWNTDQVGIQSDNDLCSTLLSRCCSRPSHRRSFSRQTDRL
jgi:hypothetical protein